MLNPADLDLHCFQKRVKTKECVKSNEHGALTRLTMVVVILLHFQRDFSHLHRFRTTKFLSEKSNTMYSKK